MSKKVLIGAAIVIVVGVGGYMWWSAKTAIYDYKVIEAREGSCEAKNRWDGCVIQILRNGKVVRTSEGLDIPKTLGGLPVGRLDDSTLVTFAEGSNETGNTEQAYFTYLPGRNSREFYYTINTTKEFSGSRVVQEHYLKNSEKGEKDFAVWLLPNASGEMTVRIASRPHADTRWCKIASQTEYENCLLGSTPYEEHPLGSAASSYDVQIERQGAAGLVEVSGPTGSTSFTLDVLTGSISKI